jgi:hypothetical protein
MTFFLNPDLTLKFGYQVIYRRFTPGTITPNSDDSVFEATEMQKQFALDHALYDGGMFSGQPANVRTNIEGGALGYFQASVMHVLETEVNP